MGLEKAQTYEWEGAFRDPLLPKDTPRLVPHPHILVTLRSEMEATSQIGL